MKKCENLIDKRFGKLVVIERAENYISPNGQKHSRWLCKCDCGNKKIIKTMYLKNGTTKSCGCLHKEIISKAFKKTNTYNLSGEYGIGYTSKGEEFYFDLDDYDLIKDYCWHLTGYPDKSTQTKYVSSFDADGKVLYMHRLIKHIHNSDHKIQIDHLNHNKQDNRKSNIKIVTNSENQFNIPLRKNNSSGYIGVGYSNSRNRWYATIRIDGKTKYLGSSKDKNIAIKLRQNAEKLYY